jgi:hypothetical protein
MRNSWLIGFALLSVAAAASDVQAFGARKRGCSYAPSSCEPSYCAPVGCSTPCDTGVGPCVSGPAYVQQTVTCYQAVTKTRTVETKVRKMVTKEVEEAFTYIELVPVVTPEQRTETVYKMVTKQVPFKYTELQQVTEPVKQTVTSYKVVTRQVPYKYTLMQQVVEPVKKQVTVYQTTTKQVPYKYTVMQQVVEPVTRTVTTYQCVPKQVMDTVTSCHMVASFAIDPCTGCCIRVCTPCVTTQQVCRTIMERIPVTREVTENVCRYVPVEKEGVRTVCEAVPSVQEVTVNVCRLVPVEKEGVRTVCESVPETQEVVVNVVRCVPVEKEGSRTICETVPELREFTVNVTTYNKVEKQGTRKRIVCEWVEEVVPVTETYCEMVPYTTTVNVPCVPSYAPPCYDNGGGRGGLFGRLGGGCCH